MFITTSIAVIRNRELKSFIIVTENCDLKSCFCATVQRVYPENLCVRNVIVIFVSVLCAR